MLRQRPVRLSIPLGSQQFGGGRGYALRVEVRIGIVNVPREIAFESSETAEAIEQSVLHALAGEPVLALTDDKGKRFVVPSASIAYVEIGTERQRSVGFVA